MTPPARSHLVCVLAALRPRVTLRRAVLSVLVSPPFAGVEHRLAANALATFDDGRSLLPLPEALVRAVVQPASLPHADLPSAHRPLAYTQIGRLRSRMLRASC